LNMINPEKIIETNNKLIAKFNERNHNIM
jgi:hypothetical protein